MIEISDEVGYLPLNLVLMLVIMFWVPRPKCMRGWLILSFEALFCTAVTLVAICTSRAFDNMMTEHECHSDLCTAVDKLCDGGGGDAFDSCLNRVRWAVPCTLVALGLAKIAIRKLVVRSKAMRAALQGPTTSQTRKELRRLEKEMTDVYPADEVMYDAIDNGQQRTSSFKIVRMMLDPDARLRTPDPIDRYNAIIQLVRRAGFDIKQLQRHMILRATLEHMWASLPPTKRAE